MKDNGTNRPEPLLPGFQFDEPNRQIVIANDDACIKDKDGAILFSGSAEVRLDLLPTPGIHIYVEADEAIGLIRPPDAEVLYLTRHNVQVKGFPISIKHSSGKTSLVWCPSHEPVIGVGDESTKVYKVLFHLFNFREFIGTSRISEHRGNAFHSIENISLNSDDWTVELQSLFETGAYFEKLKTEGGYGLTHVGYITRSDEASFDGDIAGTTLCTPLADFFSFAKGSWCYPICAIGLGASDNRVWESWSSPKETWHKPPSWFDAHHSEQLVALFPGFMNKCSNPDWRIALHEVIYWYMQANHFSRGIDAGIILTQAALERLSFEYSVRERKLITPKGFKDLRASDRIRLLLSSLEIPINIPNYLPDMMKHANQLNWLDSPHAFKEVRNSLVHPEHKRKGQFSNVYYDTWNLGLWYLELALLRICEFSGTYSNRLTERWVGEVDNVPWQS